MISDAVQQSEQAVLDAVYEIIDTAPKQHLTAQLRLPTRMGGLGLHNLGDANGSVGKAGYLAAAALTEIAMGEGADAFKPFSGDSGGVMLRQWHQVSAVLESETEQETDVAGTSEPHTSPPMDLSEQVITTVLPRLQKVVNDRLAKHRLVSLLEDLDQQRGSVDKHVAEHAKAELSRLLSLAPLGTAWLDAVPFEEEWQISNRDYSAGLRFLLGLRPKIMRRNVPMQCPCGHVGTSEHHAFSKCKHLTEATGWRHNLLLRMVRLGAKVAGFDTVLENRQYTVERALEMDTEEHEKRGDCLMCDGERLIDTDVSITHPPLKSFRSAACREPGQRLPKGTRSSTSGMTQGQQVGTSF
ncbi:MAG: hypothetical protein HC893_16490 [Chloroflexaceae bacterium]|nr:hypothetical protein [Chloroflexaceae bacterium]